METIVPGQRWISDSEPELGLGVIEAVGARDVRILFRAADTVRTYMRRNAPIRRVRLKAGERARSRSGGTLVVRSVREAGGLITYVGDGGLLPEQELLDSLSFSDPDQRLLAGQVGKPRDFALRLKTHAFRRDMLAAPEHGLAGARVELLPHQLSIARRVAARHHPRVLLADEVGLGKTIEAGLIFHRLYCTGQVSRVLVVTPPQLVHQWLVELYRRFNHMFTVMDEELARSEERGDPRANPFLNRQTMLCALDFLAAAPRRVEQAAEAGLDLLIVDEAHHLAWSPGAVSREYAAVERLAGVSGGVILITATPVQLGETGHFGRLRLLDPNRFPSLEGYRKEVAQYRAVADIAQGILEEREPAASPAEELRGRFPNDEGLKRDIDAYQRGEAGAKERLVESLVDRHGTGRLMFRNRRAGMGGFPRRLVLSAPLENTDAHRAFTSMVLKGPGIGPDDPLDLQRYLNGPAAYHAGQFPGPASDTEEKLKAAWRLDPRLSWLVGLIRRVPDEKILLICSHKIVVFALQEILPTLIKVDFAPFHENLTMTTRDRNAAWFARPDGARLLLSSEIGSEGRNFQFARHLVLFDLPLNPGVLEQRIGRLDRIGQKSDVRIHVPYVKGTAHEVLFRWYAEGLDAFAHPLLGADYFYEAQASDIRRVCRAAMLAQAGRETVVAAQVDELVVRTRALAASVQETLERGRDRLLEIQSSRPGLAGELIRAIRARDRDDSLEAYLDEVFDHYGVDLDKTKDRRGYFLFPGPHMFVDAFPCLPGSGLAFTYDREEALVHEDLAFMTVDHPLVAGAVDMILAAQEGTVAFVEWKGAPEKGLALEALFVLESAAPGRLHLARFLPPTPIRALIDQAGEDVSHWLAELDGRELERGPAGMLEQHHEQFEKLIPRLLEAAAEKASVKEALLKREAHKEAQAALGGELERLKALKAVNPSVSETEIQGAARELEEVLEHIAAAELRLDAVRLVLLNPAR